MAKNDIKDSRCRATDYPNEFVKITDVTSGEKFCLYMARAVYEMDGWKPLAKLPAGGKVTMELVY